MTAHNHCWHDAYATMRVHGETRQLEACCHCGAAREIHLRMVPVRGSRHGPYVPVVDTAKAR